jgi:hypothetical protein
MIEPKEKAEELVQFFMQKTSEKLSDYSKIEYPTAILFAKKVCSEVIGFMGADRGYKYWSDVMDALSKK